MCVVYQLDSLSSPQAKVPPGTKVEGLRSLQLNIQQKRTKQEINRRATYTVNTPDRQTKTQDIKLNGKEKNGEK